MAPQITSQPDVEVISDEDLESALGDETLHIACCVRDEFFCGKMFHPELSAPPMSYPSDVCPPCTEIHEQTLCPPRRPTHEHCPFTGYQCPPIKPAPNPSTGHN